MQVHVILIESERNAMFLKSMVMVIDYSQMLIKIN